MSYGKGFWIYFVDPKEACVRFFAFPYTQIKLFFRFVCLKLIAVHHTTLWNLVDTSCTTMFSFSAALRAKTSSFLRFVDHTQRCATVIRTSLEKRSARRRRNLYFTTHNTHKRQTSMTPAGFEHPIPATERPQIHALDTTITGTGVLRHIIHMNCKSGFISFLKCALQYKRAPRLETQFWL